MMRPFSDVDLHAFVDGQVSPERRALIDAYLKVTPEEASRVDLWRRQNEAVRTIFAGAASEPVPLWLTIGQVASGRARAPNNSRDAIQDNRLPRSKPSRPVGASARPAGVGRLLRPIGVAVVAFLAGAAMPSLLPALPTAIENWLPATPRMGQMRRVAERTIEAHRTFSVDPDRPVEITDQPAGALAAWFRHHVAVPVRVPDLTKLGWTLRGGRVVPADQGPAALMVYENAVGDRLSLLVAGVNNPNLSDTSFALLPGPTLTWLDGPVGFGLVTSKEGSWLRDNAAALYRAVYAGGDG
ncbi:hypothetical protein P7D22_12015 [Lichenihabitans sp. Uapishka_5]|uniref:anti-sigma factor family protein n=1 Tax=Lichenihabitans sp. Uapishka_5 TaxID=3037302 RepID=UPI0029E7CFDF|nr:hypothetical protein [Lichenihabitans sp. Uapishka_5]MDX7951896.1 hypothetical protein [Lichenihabitans sp. Uapishka_5]